MKERLGNGKMGSDLEEYGYRRKEIAEFIKKDPTVVTRYLRKRQSLALETEIVMKILSEEPKPLNVKTQVF